MPTHNALRVAPLLFLLPAAAAAGVIDNPYPDPLPKGPLRIELEATATGLAAPLLMLPVPDGRDRLFIVDQIGHIRVIAGGKLEGTPALDVSGRLARLNKDFDERGLLGIAFDPGFNNPQSPGHRRLFTYTSEPASDQPDLANPNPGGKPNHDSVLASWKISAANPDQIDPATRQEVLRIDQPQFNHNGGMIAFGPDGMLYIGLGDGGAANDAGAGHHPELGNSQDPRTALGKMLRIDVNGSNSRNGRYGIPADNPFANGKAALPEIFALGLRNPYRFSFIGNALLAGDVGQNKLEFLHRVEKGKNYGWRYKEGSFKFNLNGTIEAAGSDLPPDLVDPILEYDHDEGTSIIGGFVYQGAALPELRGKYVTGDYRNPRNSSGRLFYADLDKRDLREFIIGTDDRELGFLLKGFGYDHAGEIYALGSTATGPSGTTGVVMKIVPARP
jgi:glucose/arabinose dehydrogenase